MSYQIFFMGAVVGASDSLPEMISDQWIKVDDQKARTVSYIRIGKHVQRVDIERSKPGPVA